MAAAAFVLAWALAGAAEPGYSAFRRGFSELAARDAAHGSIATFGTVALAISVAVLGPALRTVLPRGRRGDAVALAFLAAGVALAGTAGVRLDCGLSDSACRDLWHAGRLSWHEDVHVWLGLAAGLLVLATPFAIARALWPAPLAAVSLSAGASGLVVAAVTFALGPTGAADLIGLVALGAWIAILAIGILHVTARQRPPSRLIPMRPRAFLASTWSGEGELLLRPLFLGRLLARRFAASREATWISDRVWRIDDAADFGNGRVQRRQMFCEFVGDDRVHITAGDLPDGIDMWIEEAGYRTSAFRVNYQLGPVPLLLRCHDVSYLADDGTFVNAVDIRSVVLGLPVARVVFHVRPLGQDRARTRGGAEHLPADEEALA